MSVEIGLKGRAEETVTDANTAQAACSGALPVYGTPFMTALMEKAAWTSIAPHLAPGESTVGTAMNITHTSPTPVGMTVTCHSELVAVEGRKLTFKVTLADEKGPVGGGTHERFIIQNEKFQKKADAKKAAE